MTMLYKIKKKFEDLKLKEQSQQLILLKDNAKKSCKKIENAIGGLISVLCIVSLYSFIFDYYIYSVLTFFSAVGLMLAIIIYEEKMLSYYYKKNGFMGYYNNLVDLLQQQSTQIDIINYFNAVENNHINIEEENKYLKKSLIENNFDVAINQIELISNKIDNINIKIENINKQKNEIHQFEQKLGIISLNSGEKEKEFEFAASFKQYL